MSEVWDPLDLQRLIDGELNQEQRRTFLAELDRQPQRWRDVALAFVEEQVWRETLGQAGSCAADEAMVAPAKAKRKPRFSWATACTVAGSLLLMLALGFYLGHVAEIARNKNANIARQSTVNVNSPASSAEHAVASSASKPSLPEPVYRLQLIGADGDGEQVVELPVYDEAQLQAANWEPAAERSYDVLNQRLERLGYRVQRRTEFLSGQLEDGRQLVVPVRTVAVRTHGQ